MNRIRQFVISNVPPEDKSVGWIDSSSSYSWGINLFINGAWTEISIQDLSDYYTKAQTYSKDEVNDIIATINQFKFEIYPSLEDVTDPKGNVLYIIGPTGTGADKYDEYVYSNNQWVKIGDTSIDLSGYAKKTDVVFERGSGENSVQQKGTGAAASGPCAVAAGGDNIEGASTPVTGDELLYAKAEGYASHAEGAAYAKGNYSHAEGGGNQIVSGKKTVPTAEGKYSHAEGTHTHAEGDQSHAEGNQTHAGNNAHAEGWGTDASADSSHAEGYSTTASSNNAHSEGRETKATGHTSHAEGWRTSAGTTAPSGNIGGTNEGNYSHSEGNYTWAKGNSSHAEGKGTRTNNIAEHAEGQFNVSISGTTRHTVGIGTADNARKNAHVITTDGKHYIPGIGTYQGTETTLPAGQDLASIISGIINNKQDKLYSGVNIKTINGSSLLGSGNITAPHVITANSISDYDHTNGQYTNANDYPIAGKLFSNYGAILAGEVTSILAIKLSPDSSHDDKQRLYTVTGALKDTVQSRYKIVVECKYYDDVTSVWKGHMVCAYIAQNGTKQVRVKEVTIS